VKWKRFLNVLVQKEDAGGEHVVDDRSVDDARIDVYGAVVLLILY
jgi:hypothetical protein